MGLSANEGNDPRVLLQIPVYRWTRIDEKQGGCKEGTQTHVSDFYPLSMQEIAC